MREHVLVTNRVPIWHKQTLRLWAVSELARLENRV